MISHHPDHELLKQFAQGKTPISISVVVAAHVEMCAECQKSVEDITTSLAMEAFGIDQDDFDSEDAAVNVIDESGEGIVHSEVDNIETSAIIDSITREPPEQNSRLLETVTEIAIAGERVSLPRSLRSVLIKEWKGFGKISRARLKLDDEARRTSLLHIGEGGHIPSHTHKGFEITLLLQGSFEDESGRYQAGDFIWLDSNHTHTPVTHEGCVCLTVADDALQFKQGVSQLFNPLGKLMY
jgi:putative transcriptional regulator